MENFLRLCASRDAIQSAFLGSGILGSASWAVSRREPAGEILNAMKDPGNKIIKMRLVGTGRFELPTPRTPSECSTRLSHVPTRKEFHRCDGRLQQTTSIQRRGSPSNSTSESRVIRILSSRATQNAVGAVQRFFGPQTARAQDDSR